MRFLLEIVWGLLEILIGVSLIYIGLVWLGLIKAELITFVGCGLFFTGIRYAVNIELKVR